MLEGQVTEEIATLKAMVEVNNAEITALKATCTGTQSGSSSQDSASKHAARAAKYAWQKVPPSSGEANTKMFEDGKYHWCSMHNAWTMLLLQNVRE
jgi:hypothetical protein